MTMTRDQIEELKRLAEKATPGEWVVSNRTEDPMNGITMISFISPANDTSPEAIVCETLGGEHDDYANAAFIAAFSPATASALLALAERALKPQGQALPETKAWLVDFPDEPELGFYFSEEENKLARSRALVLLDDVLASQLALPAGPAPEGWKLVPLKVNGVMHDAGYKALKAVGVRNLFAGEVNDAYHAMIAAAPQPPAHSPSVAQPENTFAKFCGHCQKHGHTDAECNSTRGMNEPAVAQPVADERARFEAWASEPFRADKLPLEMHPNGAYKDTRSYLIWYGWKSRAALCQPAEEGGKA